MTWSAPVRSSEAQAIYAAADADRILRPDRYRLDADVVIERATRGGEIAESQFSEGWREGLDQYLESAAVDGRLNSVGLRMVQTTAVGRLMMGARMAAAVEADPSLDGELDVPPIVIIGGWRTGTTYLFRLLAGDPRLHAPLPAELSAPWRFADVDASEREAVIDAAAGAHDLLHTLNPAMAAVHASGARLAEECVLAFGSDMRNWGFTSTVRLDGYARWLAEQDLGPSYLRYRQVLQILSRRDRRRFVLKAPAHTAELPHLAAAFPGAVVVHLHRDIVDTVASGSSLFAVFRSTYSDDVDPVDVGRFQTDQTALWFRRAAAFRASPAADAVTFVDVDFGELVAEPTSVLARIYDAASLDPPDDLAGFVAGYDRAHPRGEHGDHRYTPGDFGLDPDTVRERFRS